MCGPYTCSVCPGHPLGTATVGRFVQHLCVLLLCVCVWCCVDSTFKKTLWHPVIFKRTQLWCENACTFESRANLCVRIWNYIMRTSAGPRPPEDNKVAHLFPLKSDLQQSLTCGTHAWFKADCPLNNTGHTTCYLFAHMDPKSYSLRSVCLWTRCRFFTNTEDLIELSKELQYQTRAVGNLTYETTTTLHQLNLFSVVKPLVRYNHIQNWAFFKNCPERLNLNIQVCNHKIAV